MTETCVPTLTRCPGANAEVEGAGALRCACSKTPTVLWAQRTSCVYLTFEVVGCVEPDIHIEPSGTHVCVGLTAAQRAPADTADRFRVELDLWGAVVPERSKHNAGARSLVLVLEKAEPGFWPRLLQPKGPSPRYLKVDWNLWVDQDEEEKPQLDVGGFSNLSMEPNEAHEADSDDEDMPELILGPGFPPLPPGGRSEA